MASNTVLNPTIHALALNRSVILHAVIAIIVSTAAQACFYKALDTQGSIGRQGQLILATAANIFSRAVVTILNIAFYANLLAVEGVTTLTNYACLIYQAKKAVRDVAEESALSRVSDIGIFTVLADV